MHKRKFFIYSSGAIFVVTGIGKIWSAFGSAHILQKPDPILNWPFSKLMLTAGVIEIAIASVCFFDGTKALALDLIAWLATGLLAYRLSLLAIGWHLPCQCLGNLTDALHIAPQVADNIMAGILAYLFIGSYGILFFRWQEKRKICQ